MLRLIRLSTMSTRLRDKSVYAFYEQARVVVPVLNILDSTRHTMQLLISSVCHFNVIKHVW